MSSSSDNTNQFNSLAARLGIDVTSLSFRRTKASAHHSLTYRSNMFKAEKLSGLSKETIAERMGVDPVLFVSEGYDSGAVTMSVMRRHALAVGAHVDWRILDLDAEEQVSTVEAKALVVPTPSTDAEIGALADSLVRNDSDFLRELVKRRREVGMPVDQFLSESGWTLEQLEAFDRYDANPSMYEIQIYAMAAEVVVAPILTYAHSKTELKRKRS